MDDYGTNLRPDLVFLLESTSLGRIVIVELKAPNTSLIADHLRQLRRYMDMTEDWLRLQNRSNTQVFGYLIGSHARGDSKQQGVYDLRKEMDRLTPKDPCQVMSLGEMLDRTSRAHHEILELDSPEH